MPCARPVRFDNAPATARIATFPSTEPVKYAPVPPTTAPVTAPNAAPPNVPASRYRFERATYAANDSAGDGSRYAELTRRVN